MKNERRKGFDRTIPLKILNMEMKIIPYSEFRLPPLGWSLSLWMRDSTSGVPLFLVGKEDGRGIKEKSMKKLLVSTGFSIESSVNSQYPATKKAPIFR